MINLSNQVEKYVKRKGAIGEYSQDQVAIVHREYCYAIVSIILQLGVPITISQENTLASSKYELRVEVHEDGSKTLTAVPMKEAVNDPEQELLQVREF